MGSAEIVEEILRNESDDVKKKYLEIYEKYKDRIDGRDLKIERDKFRRERGRFIGLLYLVYDLLGYGSKAVNLFKQYGKSYVVKYAVRLKKKIPEEFKTDYTQVKEKIIKYAKRILDEVKMSEDLKEKIIKEIESNEIDITTAMGAPQSYAVYLIYAAEKKLGRVEVYPAGLCEKVGIDPRMIYYHSKKFNGGLA